MRIDVARLVSDAWALWQRDRAVLLPIAGLALFLPRLALQLLVPPAPALQGEVNETAMAAWSEAFGAWVGRYGLWYVGTALLLLWGALTIVSLYLDPNRPTVAAAMRRAGVLLPRYVLATILVGLPLGALLAVAITSPVLMIVVFAPLFYLSGRTLLMGPALVRDAPLSAVGAIVRSWQLTRGAGWTLAWLVAAPLLASLLAATLFTTVGRAGTNPLLDAIAAAGMSVAEAGATLATTLLGIAAYRMFAKRGT